MISFFDNCATKEMPPNDEVERHAVARQIVGHHSWYAFDPPCSQYRLPRDRSNRMLDCRATIASKLPLNSADELNLERGRPQRLGHQIHHPRRTERAEYCAAHQERCAEARPRSAPLCVRATEPTDISTPTHDAAGRRSKGSSIRVQRRNSRRDQRSSIKVI
jgi:hypothetical protein